jgi:hypothetical protein
MNHHDDFETSGEACTVAESFFNAACPAAERVNVFAEVDRDLSRTESSRHCARLVILIARTMRMME